MDPRSGSRSWEIQAGKSPLSPHKDRETITIAKLRPFLLFRVVFNCSVIQKLCIGFPRKVRRGNAATDGLDDSGGEMIDDSICFTSDAVMGNAPLKVGQRVMAVVEEDTISHGLNAIRVESISAKWENNSRMSTYDVDSEPKTLIGSITAIDVHGGFINHTTFFSMKAVCEGFQPCKGDWVEVEYVINSGNWIVDAISVKPLRYKRINNIRISSAHGKVGVIDESVYFTLDSLRLPTGYVPRQHDLVNVVVVESNQSCYVWRALCMAPADNNGPSLTSVANISEPYENLVEDEGGLEVSKMTNFGTLKLGETKSIDIVIETKGQSMHSLISCKLGGWDKVKQLSVQMPGEDHEDSVASLSTPASESLDLNKVGSHDLVIQ